MDKPTIGNLEVEVKTNTQKLAEDVKQELVRVVRKIVLKPFTQQLVLVTKKSSGLLIIESRRLSANCSLVAAANGVIDVSTQKPF